MALPSKLELLLEELGHERKIHYALDGLKVALKDAHSPEQNVKSVVIAGTNGKGSVTKLTSSVLKEAGLRVATYLSPHLERLTERFLLDGTEASVDELSQIAERLFPLSQKHALSYFEFLTLLFFVWAKEVRAEVLVLEVGLGGRLDATNVTEPLASVVTNIDYDHMVYLGNSLELILNEKLGVVRPRGKLISGLKTEALIGQAKKYCETLSATYLPSGDAITATGKRDWQSQELALGNSRFTLQHPGPTWVENVNTAYRLVNTAFPQLADATILKGFEKTLFPGRFETLCEDPTVILSGDHNPAGVRALVETVKALPPRSLNILCAFSPDKPREEMLSLFKTISTQIVETTIENPFSDFETLLNATKKEEVILVTGSLYLVGKIRGFLKSKALSPLATQA